MVQISDVFQYSSHSGQRSGAEKLAMGLAGGQLLGLGFVSIHHAVAGEYDLVTLLISLIL